MKPLSWSEAFGKSAGRIQASTIRELLKLTQRPGILSFAGGSRPPSSSPRRRRRRPRRGSCGRRARSPSSTAPPRATPPKGLRGGVDRRAPRGGPHHHREPAGLGPRGQGLPGRGSPVLLEAPSYMGAIQAFRLQGPRFLTVPAGEEGPDLDALEEVLKGSAPLPLPHPLFPEPHGASRPFPPGSGSCRW